MDGEDAGTDENGYTGTGLGNLLPEGESSWDFPLQPQHNLLDAVPPVYSRRHGHIHGPKALVQDVDFPIRVDLDPRVTGVFAVPPGPEEKHFIAPDRLMEACPSRNDRD